jgi:hypothetical protein
MPSLGREAKRREREPGEVEGVREKRNQVEDRDRVKERGLSQRKRSNFGVASLAPILIFSRSRALTYLQEHVLASDVKFMTTSLERALAQLSESPEKGEKLGRHHRLSITTSSRQTETAQEADILITRPRPTHI